jgi:hypothetical protein
LRRTSRCWLEVQVLATVQATQQTVLRRGTAADDADCLRSDELWNLPRFSSQSELSTQKPFSTLHSRQ